MLVEDNPGDARLVEILLSEVRSPSTFEVARAERLAEALDRLVGDEEFDVILLDLSLPDSSGLETVERTRAVAPRMPVVVLSNRDDEETALRAIQGGAVDYLVKGQGDGRLVARSIRYAIEHNRVEEALERAEEKYRSIFENAVGGIFQTSLDGRLLTANPALVRIFGYDSPEEMLRSVTDVEHQLYADPAQRAEFTRLLHEQHAVSGFEAQGRRKDGSLIWFSLDARAVHDDAGNLVGFEGTVEDVTERRQKEDALRFLAEAGAVLSSSLDYRETLASVARLAVPRLADWCAVDVLEEDGSVRRLAVAHQDPEKVALARELQERYPPDPDAPRGVPRILRTGEPELMPEIPESLLDEAAQDEEHRQILREVGLRSYIGVPLVARGRTLGAITLVSAESGRRYGDDDLELAEELARRAALAVDNARLYEEAKREIAERERAQEELRSSRDQLEIILRGVTAGITAQDGSGLLVYANEAAARMSGYPSAQALLEAPPQEVLQKFEITDESGRPFPLAQLPGRKALRGEPSSEVLLRLREVATGEERWSAVDATPISDERGNVRFVVNIFRDVTERKRIEQQLLERTSELQAIFQVLPDLFFRLAADGTILDYQAQDELYAPPEQFLGKRMQEILPPAVGQQFDRALTRVRKTGALVTIEYVLLMPQGEQSYEARLVPTSTGEVVVVARNITERKLAEEERARLAAIVESSDDAIIGKTLSGIITSWNKGAERLYGYSAHEAVGQPISMLVPPELPNDVPEILEKIRRGEKVDHFETVRVAKDGRRLDISLTVSPIKNSEGDIIGASAIARDITERKATEEALKRQARQAALRVDVGAALSRGGTLRDVLQRCTEAMVSHLDAAFARIWTLNEEEDVLELQASAGLYTHLDGAHSRVPVGELKIGLIAQERLPHMTNTVASDPRVSDKEWAKREGMVAFAGYPLMVEDRLVGVMAMFARRALAEDTLDALESVATATAQGIERKRAEEALREVREAERHRMARDLHDGALQDLSYALAEVQLVQMLPDDPERDERLRRTVEALKQAGRRLRGAVYDLRLEGERDRPFPELLRSLVEDTRRRMSPDRDVRLEVEERFPSAPLGETGTELLRILQEALTNARRHSDAHNVLVRLGLEGDEILAEVLDDGRGFGTGTTPGVGFRSMSERAAALNGQLEVDSELGEGTRVRLRAPIQARPKGAAR